MKTFFISVLVSLFFSLNSFGQLNLPSIFADNMVLQ